MALSEAQLAERRKGIGATDIAAIMGLSKWKTPFQVWEEKIGVAEQKEFPLAFKIGSTLEPLTLVEYQDKTGRTIHPYEHLLKHSQFPFIFTHIDALAEDRLVEAKSALFSRSTEWGEPGSDQMPTQYYLQCAHELMVYNSHHQTSLDKVDLVKLSYAGLDIYTYEQNDEIENLIIEKCDEFWHYVESGTPPPAINYADASSKFRQHLDNVIQATDEIEVAFYSLAEVKKQIKELEKQEDSFKAQICDYMGENGFLCNSAGVQLASWKTQISNRLDQKLLEQKYPDALKECKKPSQTRVLRLQEIK